jgi:RNA polymerase sigma factor (sigma-70 family)
MSSSLCGIFMQTDSDLLKKYAAQRDAMAFTELTRRYRSLVFNSAKRVSGNFHDAEDITQTCFVDLAMEAEKVKGPLAGWLHMRATNRALMARRADARRQKREQNAAAPEESPLTEATWELVGPLVDETIEQLPEELRLPLILYYLQEFSQEEVAHTLKISRRTVERRLRIGIDQVRAKISVTNIVVSVGVLAALLRENAVAAVPSSLRISLAKIAISGVGPTGASKKPRITLWGNHLFFSAAAKWLAGSFAGAAGIWMAMHFPFGQNAPVYDRIQQAYNFGEHGDPTVAFSWHSAALQASPVAFWRGSQPLFFAWCKENTEDWLADSASYLVCAANPEVEDAGRSSAYFQLNNSASLPLQIELLQGLISVRIAALNRTLAQDSVDQEKLTSVFCDTFRQSMLTDDTVVDDSDALKFKSAEIQADLNEYIDSGNHLRSLVRGRRRKLIDVLRPSPFSTEQLADGIQSAMQMNDRLSSLLSSFKDQSGRLVIKDARLCYHVDSVVTHNQQEILVLLRNPGNGSCSLIEFKQIAPSTAELTGITEPDPRQPAQRAAENAELLSRGTGFPVSWCQLQGASFTVRLHVPNFQLSDDEFDSDGRQDAVSLAKFWGSRIGATHRGSPDRQRFAQMIAPDLQQLLVKRSNAYFDQLRSDLESFHSDPRVARDQLARDSIVATWVGEANREALSHERELP